MNGIGVDCSPTSRTLQETAVGHPEHIPNPSRIARAKLCLTARLHGTNLFPPISS